MRDTWISASAAGRRSSIRILGRVIIIDCSQRGAGGRWGWCGTCADKRHMPYSSNYNKAVRQSRDARERRETRIIIVHAHWHIGEQERTRPTHYGHTVSSTHKCTHMQTRDAELYRASEHRQDSYCEENERESSAISRNPMAVESAPTQRGHPQIQVLAQE